MDPKHAQGGESFTATADYQVIDRAPLSLAPGDRVRTGRPDAGWPGWTWVTAGDGRGSYVPDEILAPCAEAGTAEVVAEFHARDLSVRRGDAVVSLREVKGWHWCRGADGTEGWLPAYLLRRPAGA